VDQQIVDMSFTPTDDSDIFIIKTLHPVGYLLWCWLLIIEFLIATIENRRCSQYFEHTI